MRREHSNTSGGETFTDHLIIQMWRSCKNLGISDCIRGMCLLVQLPIEDKGTFLGKYAH